MIATVRVLVVDDSSFFRKRVTEILAKTPGIEVVGGASDGLEGLKEARRLRPDVITMDVEMPVMDGISAVKRIMAELPTPIIMFSSLTREGATTTLDALDAGAMDFLPKQMEYWRDNSGAGGTLGQRVLALGRKATGLRRASLPRAEVAPSLARHSAESPMAPRVTRPKEIVVPRDLELIVIGASTGGPVALQKILTELPADFPYPVLLVVHMPGDFTTAFAQRLNNLSRISVEEASDGAVLRPGHAILAPGGKQMVLRRKGGQLAVQITEPDPGQNYRPSVDVTFSSAAQVCSSRVLGLILTGMGADGLAGARLLKANGSKLWSQDEASCVVYGMPRAVAEAGLSDQVLPLAQIGPLLGKVK